MRPSGPRSPRHYDVRSSNDNMKRYHSAWDEEKHHKLSGVPNIDPRFNRTAIERTFQESYQSDESSMREYISKKAASRRSRKANIADSYQQFLSRDAQEKRRTLSPRRDARTYEDSPYNPRRNKDYDNHRNRRHLDGDYVSNDRERRKVNERESRDYEDDTRRSRWNRREDHEDDESISSGSGSRSHSTSRSESSYSTSSSSGGFLNANCMDTLFNKQGTNIIRCDKTGPQGSEVQLKMTLPLPSQLMEGLESFVPTKQEFNSAMEHIRVNGDKFAKNFDFNYNNQLDRQVIDDDFAGHEMPEAYKSLFEAQTEGTSEVGEEWTQDHLAQMKTSAFSPTRRDEPSRQTHRNIRNNAFSVRDPRPESLPIEIELDRAGSSISSHHTSGMDSFGKKIHLSRKNARRDISKTAYHAIRGEKQILNELIDSKDSVGIEGNGFDALIDEMPGEKKSNLTKFRMQGTNPDGIPSIVNYQDSHEELRTICSELTIDEEAFRKTEAAVELATSSIVSVPSDNLGHTKKTVLESNCKTQGSMIEKPQNTTPEVEADAAFDIQIKQGKQGGQHLDFESQASEEEDELMGRRDKPMEREDSHFESTGKKNNPKLSEFKHEDEFVHKAVHPDCNIQSSNEKQNTMMHNCNIPKKKPTMFFEDEKEDEDELMRPSKKKLTEIGIEESKANEVENSFERSSHKVVAKSNERKLMSTVLQENPEMDELMRPRKKAIDLSLEDVGPGQISPISSPCNRNRLKHKLHKTPMIVEDGIDEEDELMCRPKKKAIDLSLEEAVVEERFVPFEDSSLQQFVKNKTTQEATSLLREDAEEDELMCRPRKKAIDLSIETDFSEETIHHVAPSSRGSRHVDVDHKQKNESSREALFRPQHLHVLDNKLMDSDSYTEEPSARLNERQNSQLGTKSSFPDGHSDTIIVPADEPRNISEIPIEEENDIARTESPAHMKADLPATETDFSNSKSMSNSSTVRSNETLPVDNVHHDVDEIIENDRPKIDFAARLRHAAAARLEAMNDIPLTSQVLHENEPSIPMTSSVQSNQEAHRQMNNTSSWEEVDDETQESVHRTDEMDDDKYFSEEATKEESRFYSEIDDGSQAVEINYLGRKRFIDSQSLASTAFDSRLAPSHTFTTIDTPVRAPPMMGTFDEKYDPNGWQNTNCMDSTIEKDQHDHTNFYYEDDDDIDDYLFDERQAKLCSLLPAKTSRQVGHKTLFSPARFFLEILTGLWMLIGTWVKFVFRVQKAKKQGVFIVLESEPKFANGEKMHDIRPTSSLMIQGGHHQNQNESISYSDQDEGTVVEYIAPHAHIASQVEQHQPIWRVNSSMSPKNGNWQRQNLSEKYTSIKQTFSKSDTRSVASLQGWSTKRNRQTEFVEE